MPYSERFLFRSELEDVSVSVLPDFEEEVLPDDLASFFEDEPALAFVVDDLDVDPDVLLVLELPLFADEPEADDVVPVLPLVPDKPLLVLFEDEEVGLVLLDEPLDRFDWLEF